MSGCMPIRPEPAIQGVGYAADSERAETASPGNGQSEIQFKSKPIRSDAIHKVLECSKSADVDVVPGAATSVPGFKCLATSIISALSKLWQKRNSRSETNRQALRPFKHNNVEHYPAGYPQLAAFIASDDSFCIFRKFERANSRVLLHLQTEIAALNNSLDEMDLADSESAKNYRLQSVRHEDGWDDGQRRILEKLQEKLPIYYDLLLKSNQLKALGPPIKQNHRSLFHWIEGKKPVLEEEDDWILHEDDLVAVADIDHLESSLASSFLNRLFRPSRHGDGIVNPVVTYFSQKRISTAAKSLSVFIAVAVLIVPVTILVWTPWNRTWISVTVLLFVLIFSTMLSLSASIKTKDILLGSAAYCAVLATFLGNVPSSVPLKASPSPG